MLKTVSTWAAVTVMALLSPGFIRAGEKIQFSGRSDSTNSAAALPWKQKQLFPTIDLQNTVGNRNPGVENFSVPPPYSAPGTLPNKRQLEEIDKQRNWIFVTPDTTTAKNPAKEGLKNQEPGDNGLPNSNAGVLEKFLAVRDKTPSAKPNSGTNDLTVSDGADQSKKGNAPGAAAFSNQSVNNGLLRGGGQTNGITSGNLGSFQRSTSAQTGAGGFRENDVNRVDALKLLGITANNNSGELNFRSDSMDKLANPGGLTHTTARDLVMPASTSMKTVDKNGQAPDLNDLTSGSRPGLDSPGGHRSLGNFGKNGALSGNSADFNLSGSAAPPPAVTPRPAYKPAIMEVPKRNF